MLDGVPGYVRTWLNRVQPTVAERRVLTGERDKGAATTCPYQDVNVRANFGLRMKMNLPRGDVDATVNTP